MFRSPVTVYPRSILPDPHNYEMNASLDQNQWHFLCRLKRQKDVPDPKSHPAKSSLVFSLRSLQSFVTVVTKFEVDNVIEGFGGKRALCILLKTELCQKRSKFGMQFCLHVLNNVLHVFSLKFASYFR